MALSPTTVKFLVMGLLSIGWLAYYRRDMRLEDSQPFHVAADRRDRRKARFYFLSVWSGLAAAFLSFLCLEALASVPFESAVTRDWVLGSIRGVGFFGLIIAGFAWSQVGLRVSQPNSDDKSLLPLPEPPDDRRTRSRR
ncbi:MAG TPA: hypothetical protein VFB38_08760 [Chthonomonadaceae bacterium]|nr:hypothetical protein [Chthonomonadaceae bacterium]